MKRDYFVFFSIFFFFFTLGTSGQTLNNGLLAYWNLDENSGVRHDLTQDNDLTPMGSVTSRYGINDGVCNSQSAYFGGGFLQRTDFEIDYSQDFSVFGWFSLERAETYAGPLDQVLIGKWREAGNNREWKIWFKVSQDVIYQDKPTTKSGKICFTISNDGTGNVQEVGSDFMIYTDSPFFVHATYFAGDKIQLTVGNGPSSKSTVESLIPSLMTDKGGGLLIGAERNTNDVAVRNLYGTADNVGVWNRGLNEAEVTSLIGGSNPVSTSVNLNVRIALLGDSITYGFAYGGGLPMPLGDKLPFSYSRQMETILPENYKIANYGCRGLQSHHIIQKLNDDVLSRGYNWISIAIGINDLRDNVAAATLIQNLTTIYQNVLNSSPDVKLIVNTIPPFDGDHYCNGCVFNSTDYDAVNLFIMSYGANNPRVFHADISTLLKTPNAYTLASQYDPGDHIHPNQLGCNLIAQTLANLVIDADNLTIPFCCPDADNDGVCDDDDLCEGSDDSIDLNDNQIPDGCEGCQSVNYNVANQQGIVIAGSTITKTATTNWGNGGGSSDITLSDGDYLTFQALPGNAVMVGLSPIDVDAGYTSIKYAFYAKHNNLLYVYENGINKTPLGLGSYDGNSVLSVKVEGQKVKYYLGNTQLAYESTFTGTPSFVADFALFHQNAQIRNLRLYTDCCADINQDGICDQVCSPATYSVVNQTGISISGSTITKTEVTQWANAGGSSDITISSGDYLTFQVVPGNAVMVGLSLVDANANYTSINYAFYAKHDNLLYVYENGINKTPSGLGSYDGNSLLRVQVEGQKIKYYLGNTQLAYESNFNGAPNFVVDFAMYHQNAQIRNLRLYTDCCPDTNQDGICDPACESSTYSVVNQVGISISGYTITKVETTNWANGGGASDITLSDGDCFTFQVLPGNAVMVGLSLVDANANYTSINYAFYAKHDNLLYVYENGINKTPSGLGGYNANSLLMVKVEGQKIKYYLGNTKLAYESTFSGTPNFLVDFALHHQNAQIRNLQLYKCSSESGKFLESDVLTRGISQVKFIVFPNPATNELSTNLPGDIRIYNTLGQIVKTIYHIQDKVKFSIEELPIGCYLIQITFGQQVFTTRFIKR